MIKTENLTFEYNISAKMRDISLHCFYAGGSLVVPQKCGCLPPNAGDFVGLHSALA